MPPPPGIWNGDVTFSQNFHKLYDRAFGARIWLQNDKNSQKLFFAGRKKWQFWSKVKKWRNLHLHLRAKNCFYVTENRGPLYKLFGDPLSVFDATTEGARENFSVFGTPFCSCSSWKQVARRRCMTWQRSCRNAGEVTESWSGTRRWGRLRSRLRASTACTGYE